MIVGTAGHIDHGKTTLVRALTGVDTDRLPEEKKRGISIELGYASMDAAEDPVEPLGAARRPVERIGFVDVPGHERLVHTMLAGATGIDHALLLVAADDGVMPQTREHLAVLSLLGLDQGTVVITKCDRVAPERMDAVRVELQALLQGTALAGAPVFALSAQTGEGVDALRAHLLARSRERAEHPLQGHGFRLAVDRVFALDGAGTVVTGSIHAGTVAVGDELQLVPGTQRARVRSLHAQNRAVQQAGAGQRCAVALVGLVREQVARGQWLTAPALALSTDRLDVALTLWNAETRPLRSGTPVHVHLGSAAVMGTVAVLVPDAIEPGQCGVVQLVLREPVGAWHGDRVVLRDAAASRTLAGGRVLDPRAPARYRRTPQRLAELDALSLPSLPQRLAALLAVAPQGLDLRAFAAAQGEDIGDAVQALAGEALHTQDAQGEHLIHHQQAQAAADRVLAALVRFHESHPQELGTDKARLRRLALPRWPEPLWRALLQQLHGDGHVVLRGSVVHLPAHGVQLSAQDEQLAQRVAQSLADAGFNGAWVRDLARECGQAEPVVRATLARLAQRGELHQVIKDLYYPAATMARLAALARGIAREHGGVVKAAAFRDAIGLGRHRAIQILEHFDRIGLLRRVGDLHWLRSDCQLFSETCL